MVCDLSSYVANAAKVNYCIMKQRAHFYINRKKALKNMCHPDDLKMFLIAEYNSSQNLIVKKDIRNMIDKLEHAQVNKSSINIQ